MSGEICIGGKIRSLPWNQSRNINRGYFVEGRQSARSSVNFVAYIKLYSSRDMRCRLFHASNGFFSETWYKSGGWTQNVPRGLPTSSPTESGQSSHKTRDMLKWSGVLACLLKWLKTKSLKGKGSACLFWVHQARAHTFLLCFLAPGGRRRQLCGIKACRELAAGTLSPLEEHSGSRGQDGTGLARKVIPWKKRKAMRTFHFNYFSSKNSKKIMHFLEKK